MNPVAKVLGRKTTTLKEIKKRDMNCRKYNGSQHKPLQSSMTKTK